MGLELICMIGRSRPPASSFCKTMAEVPNGNTTIYDDGARRHRYPEVGLPISFDTDRLRFYSRTDGRSYQHHSIEEPAFLLGMAFPNN